ncbi:DUF2628 domain-containing protein [Stenotrophomonas sp.]|uniref:DUF2628 domain-containing protein n=1 Tax=Stenotrophomonas sp. TaxID=69392 RepID=UPI002FCB9B2C
MDSTNTAPLSPKWQFRFNFFNTYGAPNTPEFKAAYKELPFGQKLKINFNFFALFFSWIYFFILGMWRKALVVLAISIALGIVIQFLPNAVGRGLWAAWQVLLAITANYSYYREKTQGDTSFNPFSGLRW